MRTTLTNRLWICAAIASLAGLGAANLWADDALKRVQQSLRDQGFYYGTIDGSPGDETTQAIRRYQIRNGLGVTGQLDDSTRKSIEHNETLVGRNGASASPSRARGTTAAIIGDDNETPAPLSRPTISAPPRPTPPPYRSNATTPPPQQRPSYIEEDDDNNAPGAAPAPRRTYPAAASPDDDGDAEMDNNPAAPRGAVPPSASLSAVFERTPYEFAPPPVQADVLRRAQGALLRDGFYDGAVDGVPGPATSEALSNLQEVSHIRATGRLDVQTLALLRLLPAGSGGPRRGSYYGPGPNPGPGGVYEGRIVH